MRNGLKFGTLEWFASWTLGLHLQKRFLGAILGIGTALFGAKSAARSNERIADAAPERAAESQELAIQSFLKNAPKIFGTQIEWAEPLAEAAAKGEVSYKEVLAEAELRLRDQFGEDFIKQSVEKFDSVNPGWRELKDGQIGQIKDNALRSDQDRLDARSELDPKGEALRGLSADAVSSNFDLKDSKRAEGADELLGQTLSDLKLGGTLTDDVRREVEQSTRRGQAARGALYGNSSAYQEAMETGLAGERRRSDRQGRAFDVLRSGLSSDNILQEDNTKDTGLAMGYLQSGQGIADTAYRDRTTDYINADNALRAPSTTDELLKVNAATLPQFGGYTAPNTSGMVAGAGQQGYQAGIQANNQLQANNPWATVMGNLSGATNAWSLDRLLPK